MKKPFSKNNNIHKADYEAFADPKIASKAKRAVELIRKGKFQEALTLLLKVWDVMPDNQDIQVLLAQCLCQLGVRDMALKVIERTLNNSAPKQDVLHIMFSLAQDMSMYDLSIKIARILISLDPKNPKNYVNLATAYNNDSQVDQSIAMLQNILPAFPTNPELWNVLATSVYYKNGAVEALPFYQEAIRLDPKDYRYYSNIASVCPLAEERESYFRKSLKLYAKNCEARVGLGLALLSQGKLKEGFRYYEDRQNPRRPLGQAILYGHKLKKWNWKNPSGKTLMICNEQGVGDEILFGTAIRQFSEKSDVELVIGCDRRLIKAYERTFPKAKMVAESVDAKMHGYGVRVYPEVTKAIQSGDLDIDGYVSMGDLCGHLWHKVEDIDVPDTGFLKPDPDLVDKWRDRLSPYNHSLKVGISWQSLRQDRNRRHHYLTLENLMPILSLVGVTFINLQYGDVTEDIAALHKTHGIEIKTWDDFDIRSDLENNFAVMRNLDLVLGPGIATQTFASAVGARVWWILSEIPWWTFGCQQRIPWSPTGRYYVRTKDKDDTILHQVAQAVLLLRDTLKTSSLL